MISKQNIFVHIDTLKQPKSFYRFWLFFCIIATFLFFFPAKDADAESVGDNINFLIDSTYDSNNREKIDAALKIVSNHAFFYVENEYYDSLDYEEKNRFDSDISNLAVSFDETIYPKMQNIFGSEWSPGIDGVERITILFTRTKENIGGYFNPNDEYHRSEVVDDRSNEREMLYLNAIFTGNDRIESFMAHEFQHMITWYHKTKLKNINDDIWLNEARSEYASTAIGYDNDYQRSNLRARAENFMQNQTDSLVDWQNKIQDYSSVNLFSQYVADHFGGEIFKSMIENQRSGIDSINEALGDSGYASYSFAEIFTNWSIANYLNNRYYQNGKFGYNNANLTYENFHLKPTNSYLISEKNPTDITDSLKDWSAKYYEIKLPGGKSAKNLEISFDGENSGNFSVTYILLSGNNIISVNKTLLDKNQDGKIYIKNFGKDSTTLVIVPSSEKGISASNINTYSFFISINTISGGLYPDGTILKSYKNPDVFLIENGKKRWITSEAALISNGYDWNDITYVNSNELDFFESGENLYPKKLRPDGTLIKGNGPKVYVVENGRKRWIVNASVFIMKGYKWESIANISDSELGSYVIGTNISVQDLKPDGTLIKGNGPKVYVVENGRKRWIVNASVFILKGYKWENVITIQDWELESYENGPNINK